MLGSQIASITIKQLDLTRVATIADLVKTNQMVKCEYPSKW